MKRIIVLSIICFLLADLLMLNISKQKPIIKKETLALKFDPKVIKLSFPAFSECISDIIYMRLCVFFGEKMFTNVEPQNWGWILNNINTITTIDPYYFDPYYMTGTIISWEVPKSLLNEVNEILKKGLNYVSDFRIPFFLGFNYFYFLDNKEKGAYYLKIASERKNSPKYLPLLISRLYTKSGKIDTAIAITEEQLKREKNKDYRKLLEKRLKALYILKQLQSALNLYQKKFGYCPKTLQELKQKGIIDKIPKDPYEGEFYIEKDCRIWTTSNLR